MQTNQSLFKYRLVFGFYAVVLFLDGFTQLRHYRIEWGHFWLKPLLVSTLLFAFWLRANKAPSRLKTIYYTVLSLALVGDVVLLFQGYDPNFISAGLLCFSVVHILNAWIFLREFPTRSGKGLFGRFPALLIFPVGLAFLILAGLAWEAGELSWVIIVFVIAITAAGITAFNMFQLTRPLIYELAIGGMILFVFSNTLWGIDKFIRELFLSDYLIMISYGLAMGCITHAVCLRLDSPEGVQKS